MKRSDLVIAAEKNIKQARRANDPKWDGDDWVGFVAFMAMIGFILFFVHPL